ncbi:MAG: LysE family transporter [Hyphomicrobiales bacterium]|nr:LysE family transporter [Hyphomicrobiales bacterium]MCP5001990.1 LysE family transporter [Hyphomicrobiales bacterium]
MDQIYLYLLGILLAYLAFFLGIVSPGPNILAIIGTSMSVGRQSGISLAMGVALGSLCWALLTAFGLSAILATYTSAMLGIKIAGGLFLLWLAFKSFRAAASHQDMTVRALSGGKRTPMGYFTRGYIIQMTNPKAVLAWIAIMSLGLGPQSPVWVAFVIVAGTALMSVIFHYLFAVAFSTPLLVSAYARARRWIQGFLGAFFTFAGIKLLLSRS